MKALFRNWSIRRKLMLAILATSTAAVCASALTMVVYERARLRKDVETDLRVEAELVSQYAANALRVGDTATAWETLHALWSRHEIVQACLYTPDGGVFVEYNQNGRLPPPPVETSKRVEVGRYAAIIFQPVHLANEMVGVVYLRADMRERMGQLHRHLWVALAAISGALAFAFLVSLQMQHMVAAPLISLTRITRKLAVEGDYSIRVPQPGNDEVGELGTAFNQMIEQIARRKAELAASEERYRLLVQTAPEGISVCVGDRVVFINECGAKMFGAANAAEMIGRSVMDFVHPDFRKIVTSRIRELNDDRRSVPLMEQKLLRLDGTVFDAEVVAVPVLHQGQPALQSFFRDITGRRRMEEEILEISERERARIGQDIHDGLCQQLVGVTFVAKLLQENLRAKNLDESTHVHKIGVLVQEAIIQARGISRELYPVHLVEEGLCVSLKRLAEQVTERCKIQCVTECDITAILCPANMVLNLYHIAQEAVNNSVKHANPNTIRIGIRQSDGVIELLVQDDGIGITGQGKNRGGLGLRIMEYRTHMVGGTLEIRPREGGGTTVSCRCPITA